MFADKWKHFISSIHKRSGYNSVCIKICDIEFIFDHIFGPKRDKNF